MAVKILIKRKIPDDLVKEMMPLVRKLRAIASNQPGYISGETLQRVDKPGQYLVISTWQSIDAWNTWTQSQERTETQLQIDALLGDSTEYELYRY